MDEIWNSETLAKKMLEVMPRLTRLMTLHMTSLTENETTMMQIGALHMLMKKNMTTSDLAKMRHVSLQAASSFVQGLVDRGLVLRVEDPHDRRRAILEVTEEGCRQAEALREQMSAHLSTFMSELSSEEIEAGQVFLNGLQRIVQQYNLDEAYQETE